MTACAVAAVAMLLTAGRSAAPKPPITMAIGAGALLLWQPRLVVAGGVVAGVWRIHRGIRRRTHRASVVEADITVVAELTRLGLTAGLGFSAALRRAACEVGEPLETEVESVLRRAREHGLAAALRNAGGHLERLFRLAAGAIETGAPLERTVAAFVDELRRVERARRLRDARILPVRLLFPLALLILPGFVLVTMGPALIGSLDRLQIPLPTAVGRLPI